MPRPRHIVAASKRLRRRTITNAPKPEPAPSSFKARAADFILTRNTTVKSALVNWKTTLGGLATLFGGLTIILTALQDGWQTGDFDTVSAGITAITGGAALIFARDGDKSSQDSGVK